MHMSRNRFPVEKWSYFITTRIWPKIGNLNPADWLRNFRDDELDLALRLLDGFLFYSNELVDSMFKSAFVNISQLVIQNKKCRVVATESWRRFVDTLIVVRVTGEKENDTDSGYQFSRKSRDILSIDQNRILSPETALQYLEKQKQGIVFSLMTLLGLAINFATHGKEIIRSVKA